MSSSLKPYSSDSWGFGGWIRETKEWFMEPHAGHTKRFHNNESELLAMVMAIEYVIQTYGRAQSAI